MNGNSGALVLGLAWLVVIALLGGLGATIHFFGNPLDGQSIVTLELPKRKVAEAATPPPALPPPPVLYETPPGGIVPAVISPQEQAAMAAPPVAQTMAQSALPPPPPIYLPPPPTGGLAIANPAVLEKSPDGYLPRIADGGLTPMQAYGAPVAAGNRPRIAIVISGLGISAKATEAAITGLPPGVTLAFAPYANDVQRWVTMARQKGHEVLLQVPMEPYDFPDSDPGQYTLRTSVNEEANTKRLAWSLTRITGYVGVTNLLGGRFLTDAGAVEPMLTFLMRRGLLFYDNGSATRSVAPDVAARLGTPFAQATSTIDSIQAAMEIDHRLADLETEARTKGKATGSGFLYPVTVERVNLWARGLAGRGFVLAPVSSIVTTGKK